MKRPSWGKIFVVTALVGAVAFGGLLGYLAYVNDSFPSQTQPFGDYAVVSSAVFNGTEYAFNVTWLSGNYLPEYAQMWSSVSDVANSPICSLGLSSVASGQLIFMPFGISGASTAAASVYVSIAVKPTAGGASFTIQQEITNFTLQTGDISPSSYACTEQAAIM